MRPKFCVRLCLLSKMGMILTAMETSKIDTIIIIQYDAHINLSVHDLYYYTHQPYLSRTELIREFSMQSNNKM